ncbi:prostate and testis expressed protein 1 isoform X2 [Peromyscus eremicus]|uniref:prostate and testis expressed protein 1 isoform X2 n=1 Tax=Peromyscus eremicus TaxID=42410 RepID=UPI0027DDFD29|nr:prostate and testis expressed protein 1 isoform X2 [Peromyscus eremicus]
MGKSYLMGCLILLCRLRVFSASFAHEVDTSDKVLVGENNVVEIVQCRMCHLQFPGEKCSRGRGICTATAEEACMFGKIFKNSLTPEVAGNITPRIHYDKREMEVAAEAKGTVPSG